MDIHGGIRVLTKVRDTLRAIWRRASLSTIAPPRVSALEQTKSSWAKRIESYAAVPPAYSAFFEPFLAEGRAFPYAVLTPTYEGFIHRTAEKLVCDFGHEICVLERRGSTWEVQCYPLEAISYVEVRAILLDSRIKISGMTKQGVPASSTLRFNTVTDCLFMPILETIRRAPVGSSDAVPSSELSKFDQWVRLNFKFMNYAKRSVLAGEKVIHAFLQPEIRASVVTVLGKTYYRTISPTHVSILTDRELIMIAEEKRPGGEDRYGGIWDYIPLNKIATLSLDEKDGSLLVLSIELPEGARLEFLYPASARQELEQLLDRFRQLTTGRHKPGGWNEQRGRCERPAPTIGSVRD